MRVVIAPDSMGGLLDASGVAQAIATGWHRVRPDDDLHLVPMSDGGEGLLAVLQRPEDRTVEIEVAGPDSRPVQASFLVRDDGTAIVESASACGLHLLAVDRRNPLHTTTYGVGQLLDAARTAGAKRILLGLGGSATVDGGAGALTGLGLRLRVADGSGLKIGGDDLYRVAAIERGWIDPAWEDLPVVLLADVRTHLEDAARVFGPQKGATSDAVRHLEAGLSAWADVVERDLDMPRLRERDGTGAAGGLGYGLLAALRADLVPGADAVAREQRLAERISGSDVVVTGEGRLDATSFDGKVVGTVLAYAERAGVPTLAVVGDDRSDEGHLALAEIARATAGSPDAARDACAAAGEVLARTRG